MDPRLARGASRATLPSPSHFFAAHRSGVIAVLAGVELTVLLILLLRRFGGLKGLRRGLMRVARYFGGGFRDLVEPVVARIHFRRRVRLVSDRLLDPTLPTDCLAALRAARAALADEQGSWAYLVEADPVSLLVAVAGPARTPPPETWRPGPGAQWVVDRQRIPVFPPAPGTGTPGGDRLWAEVDGPCLVVVGVANRAVVLLDLAAAPGVLVLGGSRATAEPLAGAIAAQLTSGLAVGAPVNLLVTEGVVPGFTSHPLAVALDDLERRLPGTGVVQAVLICDQPTPDQAERIAALVDRDASVRVLIIGDHPGPHWRLDAGPGGELAAPELGLLIDASPLDRGVRRAVRVRRRVLARSAATEPRAEAAPPTFAQPTFAPPASPPVRIEPPPMPPVPPPGGGAPVPSEPVPAEPARAGLVRTGPAAPALAEHGLAEPAPADYVDADAGPALASVARDTAAPVPRERWVDGEDDP